MQLERGEKFFRGSILQPGRVTPKVVVGKATQALANSIAVSEARKLGVDWLVEHCEVVLASGLLVVNVLEQWSSCAPEESTLNSPAPGGVVFNPPTGPEHPFD